MSKLESKITIFMFILHFTASAGHMRPERPIHMPQMVHPALREKGNAIPHPTRRTMDMDARVSCQFTFTISIFVL